ncbi:MAG: gliding motility-associated C-terminal domain-containing protein [Flavobacteriales bacterium]
MKKRLLIYFSLFGIFSLFGQENSENNWTQNFQKARVFIENKGQFDEYATNETGKILFGVDFGSTRIFFGKTGIHYSFLEAVKVPKAQRDALRAELASIPSKYKEQERIVGKFKFKSDDVSMRYVNANAKVKLSGRKQRSDEHNYSVQLADGSYEAISHASAFEELIYENIYPLIDLKFTVHPQIGLKYVFIVHPGGNPANIEMEYDRNVQFLQGEIHIPTAFGDIIDHAPISFQGEEKKELKSAFGVNQKMVKFEVESYQHSADLFIDPWIQTPVFATNWDVVWECDRDGAGNVYALGGIMPMQILKYNAAGTLQWTYNTPYDTSNVWLGTFAVDNAGNSYVTAGSVAQIQKISPTGALLLSNANPGGILSSAEFWTIAFNCDETSLVIGGTGGALLQLDAVIYNVNTSTLNMTNQQFISNGPTTSIPPNVEEVRSITSAKNGKYYFMTQDTMGYVNDNFTLCPTGTTSFFKMNHGASWGYKLENYRYDNSGICALATDQYHLYVNRGNKIEKRSLQDCSFLQDNSIPGGQYNTLFPSGHSVGSSGIAIDQCGNIYVGSTTGVVKYDGLLIQQAFYPTNFAVYDLEINTNGELIAVGGTGTSTSSTRSGAIRSFAIGACAPFASTCCDATICQPSSVCLTDAPITLIAGSSGGTWSGPGVNANGVFNPSIAGVGVQTIVYTLPCGADSIQITVSPCAGLQVCVESNGQFTVSGGVGPYTWSNYVPATNTPITNQTECQNCGYTWFFGQCLNGFTPVTACSSPAAYVNFATGTTVTPPIGSTQFQVTDNTGTIYQFTGANLTPCTTSPCTSLSVTSSSLTNVSCFGGSNGAISVISTGGVGPYTYTWTPNVGVGANVNNLSSGTYTVNVVDVNNCTGTLTMTITQPIAELSVTTSSTSTLCGTANGTVSATPNGGTAPYSYLWSPGNGNTATLTTLSAGVYSLLVTDANGCTANGAASVSNSNGPNVSCTQANVSCFGGSNGAAMAQVSGGTSPYIFAWTPSGGTNATASNLTAGTYTLQVTDNTGCIGTASVTISEPSPLVITETIIPSSCTTDNGSVSVLVTGGVSPFTYTWNPVNSNVNSISNLAPGTSVSLVVSDANDCGTSETYQINGMGSINVTASPISTSILEGQSVPISASGALTYVWSPPDGLACTNCAATNASPSITTLYTVTGTAANGCTGQAQVQIYVTEVCGDIYVPTIFSPASSNNENKQACVYGNCIAELDYAIYDRWGQCVFQTKDQNACWDGKFKGKEMNAGVFAYKLMVKLQNGNVEIRSGNLTLLK